MKDFKKGGGFRKSFESHRESKPLFEATCINCHKRCEVPFRPANGRPIYCRDCFGSHSPDRGERQFKKPFNKFAGGAYPSHKDRQQVRPESSVPRVDTAQIAAQTSELKLLNQKIDRLIGIIESQQTFVSPVAERIPATKAKATKTKTRKQK